MYENNQAVSLYLTFYGEELRILLFKLSEREILSDGRISLSRVVPDLPESVESELIKCHLSFQDLKAVYLIQKPSRWNSNRLVSAFVRTVGFCLPVSLHILNCENDSSTECELLEEKDDRFGDSITKFKEVRWKDFKTLYNSGPITNM